MVRVFLSSSLPDLREHRAAIIAELEGSYSVDAMERFGAHAHNPDTVCRDFVARCDVFILLVARRYGKLVPGYRKSMTRLEYDYATRRCKPRLVFLLDDNVVDWKGEVDDGEKAEPLRSFRTYLAKNHACGLFNGSPTDLAQQVKQDLEKWKKRENLAAWLSELYPPTRFVVEPSAPSVIRATAERLGLELDQAHSDRDLVPIGVAGGPLVREIIERLEALQTQWEHSQWIAMNAAGESTRFALSANYQCARLAEITGGVSLAFLSRSDDDYEKAVRKLRILICSCGGTKASDSYLFRQLDRRGGAPDKTIGDFCLTPIDRDGNSVPTAPGRAKHFLSQIQPHPKFQRLTDLRGTQCKILFPFAQTKDNEGRSLDLRNKVDVAKVVLKAGVVDCSLLTDDIAQFLLPPRIRKFQLLEESGRWDGVGKRYPSTKVDTRQRRTVRIIDTGDGAGGGPVAMAPDPDEHLQEIIISDPPEPVPAGLNFPHEHPYVLEGKIRRTHVSTGVRKPGNWAATAIRVAKQQIVLITHGEPPRRRLKVLDLGCGSGAIGLNLAEMESVAEVTFSDLDPLSLDCVRLNRNCLEEPFRSKCLVLDSPRDLFKGILTNSFDLVVFGPPFFPHLAPALNGINHAAERANLAGPKGHELALRFVQEVPDYLREHGCAITYLPDYVDHREVVAAADAERMIVDQLPRITILYPEDPKHQFPQSFEIQNRQLLEQWLGENGRTSPFTDEVWNGRRFLAFEMAFFVMTKIK